MTLQMFSWSAGLICPRPLGKDHPPPLLLFVSSALAVGGDEEDLGCRKNWSLLFSWLTKSKTTGKILTLSSWPDLPSSCSSSFAVMRVILENCRVTHDTLPSSSLLASCGPRIQRSQNSLMLMCILKALTSISSCIILLNYSNFS